MQIKKRYYKHENTKLKFNSIKAREAVDPVDSESAVDNLN